MYDVYGLGNALVDMEFTIEDSASSPVTSIPKGHMTLVDEPTMDALVTAVWTDHAPNRMSGGSAANTLIAGSGIRRPDLLLLQGGRRRDRTSFSR